MRIGTLFDIPIRVHWSWLFGFVFLTMMIASGGLPFISVNLSSGQEWFLAGFVTICLFVSVLLHELAHSLTAKRLGYSVISITLMIFGGVSVIAETRGRASHDFMIAAAGPGMSLLLGVVAALAYLVYRDPFSSGVSAMIEGILFYVGLQNVALAIFNMLPGLPLDGGRVLQSSVWALTGNRRFAARFAGRAGQALGILIIAAAIYMIVGRQDLSGGLWLIVIAMFILPTSMAEAARARRSDSRPRDSGVVVRSVMTPVPTALNATTPLDAAVKNVISRHPDLPIPVITEGQVTATVSMQDVLSLGLSQNQGAGLTIADVAQPVRTFVIEPGVDVSLAEQILERRGIDLLLVFESGYLIGTVSPDDLDSEDGR